MATKTPNYNLTKPATTDEYDIGVPNANMDAIDAALLTKLDKTGDGSNVTNAFDQAATRANLITGEKQSILFGKIKKWFADLGDAAFKNTGTTAGTVASGDSVSLHNADANAHAAMMIATNSTPVTDINPVISFPATAYESALMAEVQGNLLKNELNYTPSTWVEWELGSGVVGDSTGLTLTSNGTSDIFTNVNTSIKQNTKYGFLYSVPRCTVTSDFYVGYGYSFNDTVVPKIVGNNKAIVTSKATIEFNKFYIYTKIETSGHLIEVKDLRLFELPAGSQIESDFTNLTADQLAAKYSYIKGDSPKSVGPYRLKSSTYQKFKTAYEVQMAVRNNTIQNTLSVGDFFTVGKSGTDWLFQVVAFDYDVPVNSAYTHSMRLLMYPCFGNVAFDSQEAIYYATAPLAAGTYWFLNNQDNKYYSFTINNLIELGGQIVFTNANMTAVNTYHNGASTTIVETAAVTMSTTQPSIGTQLTPVNDGNRARYGSNNWMQSAIRQWLNSAAATGWWSAKNNYDRPQASPVDGFLHGIDADFLACIGKVRLRTGLNPVDNAGTFGYSDNEELIFFPSRSEMGLGNSVAEIYETPVALDGTAKTDVLPLFKSNADRIKYLSGVARHWWMRSPYPTATSAYNTYCVYTDGSLISNYALSGFGAVPACVIY